MTEPNSVPNITSNPAAFSPPPVLSSASLEWRWKAFEALDAAEVYDMLRARSTVFVIEQHCLYGDIDGLDVGAWHLFAYGVEQGVESAGPRGAGEAPVAQRRALAGYLRVLPPDEPGADARIGRVLTTSAFRGIGLGRALLDRALGHVGARWPGVAVRLHAQAHLQPFYGAFGFEPVSAVHDEDGIAHVWMRRVR